MSLRNLTLNFEVLKETAKTMTIRVITAKYTDKGRNPVSGFRCRAMTEYDLVEGRGQQVGTNYSYEMMTKFLNEDRKSLRFHIIRELNTDKNVYLKFV